MTSSLGSKDHIRLLLNGRHPCRLSANASLASLLATTDVPFMQLFVSVNSKDPFHFSQFRISSTPVPDADGSDANQQYQTVNFALQKSSIAAVFIYHSFCAVWG
jgi:hypothetical protein